MFRASVLLIAVLMSSPAFFSAFVAGTMSPVTALIRFLIAVPVAASMMMVYRSITASYHKAARRKRLNDAIASSTPPNV
ncbi:MAG: hypothetical protein JWN95_942 [Frankiales bacterium]|nr:hypothetical protein [Frankiales bacterium]